jgi:PAS domain S-box-containing protein
VGKHSGDVVSGWAQSDASAAERAVALLASLDTEEGLSPEVVTAVFANAPVGLGFIDAHLRFRWVNDRFASIDGVTAEGHAGRALVEVWGPPGEVLRPSLAAVLAGGEPQAEMELRVAKVAGLSGPRDWLASCAPIRSAGQIVGLSCVLQDVSVRKRAQMRASFLVAAGEVLDSSLDYHETLQSVARLAVPDVADWCSISMVTERGSMYRVAVAHSDPRRHAMAQVLIEREALPLDAPAGAAAAMRIGETQVFDEFPDELLVASLNDPGSVEVVRELGLGSAIIVPLTARGRMLGAISLIGETPSRFSASDVQLAEALARRAAINIDNARLYTEHSGIARILQAGLLAPGLPLVPGLELAARYRPIGEFNDVGGDFYDAYLRSPEEWLVVMGDITGKGAQAAATTAMVRYTLRAAALHPGTPSELLGELNRAMLAQRVNLCTIAVVSVRPGRDGAAEMTVCLAGHPPPLLLGADGSVTEVGAPGTLLGHVEDAGFSETRFQLEDGDTLLLYTDGLIEAAAPPAWTQEQLHERVRACVAEDLGEFLRALEGVAVEDAGGRPRDDIALLAMRAARSPA